MSLDTEKMIIELRAVMEQVKDNKIITASNGYNLNLYALCNDVARRLEELTSRNCDSCKHNGAWENELEYGYPCPCIRCSRRCQDNYESTWSI